MNTTVSEGSKFAPYETVFGQKPNRLSALGINAKRVKIEHDAVIQLFDK